MVLCSENFYVTARRFLDTTEFTRELDTCERGRIMLGSIPDIPYNHWLFEVRLVSNTAHRLGIGAPCSHAADTPVLLLTKPGHLVVGADTHICAIDVIAGRVLFSKELDLPLFCMLWRRREDSVIVIYEIGAIALDERGFEQWHVSRDVVSGYEIIGDVLTLRFMDEPSVRVHITNGEETT